MIIREANLSDAKHFVRVFELASRGLAQHLWAIAAGPDGDVASVAEERMRSKLKASDPNTVFVAEIDDRFVGGVMTFVVGDEPEELDPTWDPAITALVELENRALGTHYVNALAVLPEFQGRGIGRALLQKVEEVSPVEQMSLTVEDMNVGAKSLYESEGYKLVTSWQITSGGWETTELSSVRSTFITVRGVRCIRD